MIKPSLQSRQTGSRFPFNFVGREVPIQNFEIP